MADVEILNTGGPHWFPPAKGKKISGAQMLRPGPNRVNSAYWEAIKGRPDVQKHFRGPKPKLVLNPTAAQSRDHTHVPDRTRGVVDLTVEKAKPWIQANENADQLLAWRNADKRKSIHDLIDDRLAELTG